MTDMSDFSHVQGNQYQGNQYIAQGVPVNTLNVPREVRTVPQNFEIDNGPNFPRGYNDDFEFRNGVGFCCCTIPQLISCMCIGSGIALLLGIFNLFSLITTLAIIKKGEDVTLWLPEN